MSRNGKGAPPMPTDICLGCSGSGLVSDGQGGRKTCPACGGSGRSK